MIFIKHFFKSAKYTGAIAPSSPFLAKKMADMANLEDTQTIVELGPGTGAITKELIKRKSEHAKLLTFDINKDFVTHLKNEYPQAEHFHCDITHLKEELKKNAVDSADVIISGIPFADFNKKECDEMLSEINNVMDKNSLFILFTYSPLKFKTFFSWFDKVDMCYVPLNLPPAHVLTLRKK